MRRVTRLGAAAAVLAAAAIGGFGGRRCRPTPRPMVTAQGTRSRHVLLISVDGMHQSDLDWYIANHPGSELAKLASGGAEFTNNHTSDPSDSDPGGTAIMTGGDPRATGVYYDVEYSHGVFPPGTTSCSGAGPGWRRDLRLAGRHAQCRARPAPRQHQRPDVPVLRRGRLDLPERR